MTLRIVWFRRDLRLADNQALAAALETSAAIIPVAFQDAPGTGGAVPRSWRHLSLMALGEGLRRRGSWLELLRDDAVSALPELVAQTDAVAVHCTRDWTPASLAEEDAVREALAGAGVALIVAEGSLLATPDQLSTVDGGPYRVFTPYHRAWLRVSDSGAPTAAPERIPAPGDRSAPTWPPAPEASSEVPDLADWWIPGECGATRRLREFVSEALPDYATNHDVPASRGTSELSLHLAVGSLSPRQIAFAARSEAGEAAEPFLRQLAWREFAAHVLYHFPHTAQQPMRAEFAEFPWGSDASALEAWGSGLTGYPLVDAGMRQLAATGWMHNRVRMVCGSFLTKDLLVPWQEGEEFFRERLADYEQAANVFNWQWVAGCGADAAPYFRIFSPERQGKRFDSAGEYVRRWVPELAGVPDRWIHHPHDAPTDVLTAAGVTFGETYPLPLVDHAEARTRALAAYAAIRGLRL